MYNYACNIEWKKGSESRAVWQEFEEQNSGWSFEWEQIVKGAKEFAIKVQDVLRKGIEHFETIVEKTLDSVIEAYNFSRAQTFEVICILSRVWVHGDELRVWSNTREGAPSSFSGVYFANPANSE